MKTTEVIVWASLAWLAGVVLAVLACTILSGCAVRVDPGTGPACQYDRELNTAGVCAIGLAATCEAACAGPAQYALSCADTQGAPQAHCTGPSWDPGQTGGSVWCCQ